ncbi:hypothetical protein NBO_27g0013 [Nosema bombycis CQ1]|uniref:Uncharacterized protein n=1 Tax=Nosema bombycis (strain CQ1 / CVCC 102059) TaxID=578461 RepID=R0KUE9_NOSB1|nr:hypothetical protein NBO_27g0013 [Nosema bombycis CQ1]|eukprot:EOB14456.1 hypothetical protein NBO_27g0013 [Nosema bombycis CQ1]
MRQKKIAQRSLQLKDFDSEYKLVPCVPHPSIIKNLTDKTKKFIKEYNLSEDKYFEIYKKLSKRNLKESKEYLESCGFENSSSVLMYFNK